MDEVLQSRLAGGLCPARKNFEKLCLTADYPCIKIRSRKVKVKVRTRLIPFFNALDERGVYRPARRRAYRNCCGCAATRA